MIPAQDIVAWSNVVPWGDQRQVEQDLIISCALIEIFSEESLRTALRLSYDEKTSHSLTDFVPRPFPAIRVQADVALVDPAAPVTEDARGAGAVEIVEIGRETEADRWPRSRRPLSL